MLITFKNLNQFEIYISKFWNKFGITNFKYLNFRKIFRLKLKNWHPVIPCFNLGNNLPIYNYKKIQFFIVYLTYLVRKSWCCDFLFKNITDASHVLVVFYLDIYFTFMGLSNVCYYMFEYLYMICRMDVNNWSCE